MIRMMSYTSSEGSSMPYGFDRENTDGPGLVVWKKTQSDGGIILVQIVEDNGVWVAEAEELAADGSRVGYELITDARSLEPAKQAAKEWMKNNRTGFPGGYGEFGVI